MQEPLIRQLWKDHYASQPAAIKADLNLYGWDCTERVDLKFITDNSAGILYHGGEPCALITVDWSEPCLKITYVQA